MCIRDSIIENDKPGFAKYRKAFDMIMSKINNGLPKEDKEKRWEYFKENLSVIFHEPIK